MTPRNHDAYRHVTGERLASIVNGEVDAYVQEHQRSDPEGQAVPFEERIMFPWSRIY